MDMVRAFIKMVSEDLKDIFPDVKSFSPTNLKYMRYFYEMYPCAPNRPQAVDDLGAEDKCPQVVDDLTSQFADERWKIRYV
jgi:hypothetical protein